MIRRSQALLLIITASLASRPVNGKEHPAAEAFARGKQLFETRDFIAAAAAFEEAYRLRPHHAVQCSIARCHENLSQFVEASEHYRRCLKEGGESSGMAKRIGASLKKVEARITWVQVGSPGKGGTIYRDGLALGAAPRRVALNPGSHILEVRRAPARPASVIINTIGGETREVDLVPQETSALAGPASMPTPFPSPAPPPSSSRRTLSPAWFWSTLGLTVALAGAATALGILTLKQRSDYEARPDKEGYDRFVSLRLTTNVLWGLCVG
jgi:hypothetical protein